MIDTAEIARSRKPLNAKGKACHANSLGKGLRLNGLLRSRGPGASIAGGIRARPRGQKSRFARRPPLSPSTLTENHWDCWIFYFPKNHGGNCDVG